MLRHIEAGFDTNFSIKAKTLLLEIKVKTNTYKSKISKIKKMGIEKRPTN